MTIDEAMTNPTTLLPCPFCGSADHLHVSAGKENNWIVHCSYCAGQMRAADRDCAIRCWNCRQSVAERDEAVKRLAAIVDRMEKAILNAVPWIEPRHAPAWGTPQAQQANYDAAANALRECIACVNAVAASKENP